METITHYKKNLQEREDALAEKEKIILELRSTTRTLENFRWVGVVRVVMIVIVVCDYEYLNDCLQPF